jgi:hypothetical protein
MTSMHLNSEILKAIKQGDLGGFSRLVGNDEILRNAPNAFGSWLHCACTKGQLPIAKYLVENGANVNLRGGTVNQSPLEDAISFGHLPVVKYLLSKGAELDVSMPTRNPLFCAISDGHVEIVKFLLSTRIYARVVYRSVTGKLKNALSYATERGEKEIVELLVKAGCRLPVEGVDKPVWQPEEVHEPTAEDKAREQIIAHMAAQFGPVDPLAQQEIVPVHEKVHVAIHVIRPNDQHPFLTLFTAGMSNQPINVPSGQEAYRYAELVMHLPATWPHPREKEATDETFWPFEWLRKVAYYPHIHNTWLGGAKTIISSDEPPVPLGPNTKQTCLLLLADFADWSPMTLDDGRSVHFYTVIPIYTEERDFEKQYGITALVQPLQQHGYTAVVNVDRANVAE